LSASRIHVPDSEFVEIPGGGFSMGGSAEPDHQPVHEVEISAFRLTRCPITNAQYVAFCGETGHRLPAFWGEDRFRSGSSYREHPVTGVSWNDAIAFSAWAGGRLITEAEWEYAARGGLAEKVYPFGDEIDPSQANYARSDTEGTTPVGQYAPNGFGLHDMCGNVVEWVDDRYDPTYYARSLIVDPHGPKTGKHRVIRGGGWHSGPYCCRVDFRNALPANWVDFAVGFRVARAVD
jgi:formylglycine-generating enzyme required for sulfatase activity